MPMKSAVASGSVTLGEPAPNTVARLPLFSSSMLAVDTPPTLHPARVNGTHGAGVFLPLAVTLLKAPVPILSVQYWNALAKPPSVPFGL